MPTASTPTKIETGEQESSVTNATAPMLHLSTSPHIRHSDSVPQIMFWVVMALLPAFVASIVFFGVQALTLTCVSVTVAVLTEWVIVRLLRKPSTIGDFSAIITGILVAFNVPPGLPWWMVAIGAAFSIGVAKMAFGGLGGNFINPALAGRAFLMASYPAAMTTFTATRLGSISGIDSLTSATSLSASASGVDGLTSATPLAAFKAAMTDGNFQALDFQDAISNLFFGNVGGCIGETSALALLLGAMLLIYKRIISARIPIAYIGTVFLLYWMFNGTGELFTAGAFIIPVYQVLAGGLMLGAFFMATDMVTTPITPNGKILFGVGCGVLTFLIRKFGGYPEGVSYSILLMNLVVPHLDRYTKPRIYGEVTKRD